MAATMPCAGHPAAAYLAPIGLDEIDQSVALQTRCDRKYLVTASELDRLLHVLDRSDHRPRVLEIEGRRTFAYRSVYFDTSRHDSYLAAARRRPSRWKVRTRTYCDTGTCWIEVKLRDGRGQNVKRRRSHDPSRSDALTAESLAFVQSFGPLRRAAFELRPALVTEYARTTLVVGDQRVTVDAGLMCAPLDDGTRAMAVGVGDRLVVETKSPGAPGPFDRALWSIDRRPVRFSKFAIGMASAHLALPSNHWHRSLDRHVRVAG